MSDNNISTTNNRVSFKVYDKFIDELEKCDDIRIINVVGYY